jgi:hypothetical protein
MRTGGDVHGGKSDRLCTASCSRAERERIRYWRRKTRRPGCRVAKGCYEHRFSYASWWLDVECCRRPCTPGATWRICWEDRRRFFGHHLLLTLKTEGVDTRFLTTAKAQSTLAFVAMEEGEPAFSFYGEGTVDSLLTADDVPETLHQETGILYVGSVSLLSGTRLATVLATVERLKGKALLSLDPNMGSRHFYPPFSPLRIH